MEVVVTTAVISKAPVKSSSPTNQHPTSYALAVAQSTLSEHSRQKVSHSMDLITLSPPGVFHHCLWPLRATGYLVEDCQASRQHWRQYPTVSKHWRKKLPAKTLIKMNWRKFTWSLISWYKLRTFSVLSPMCSSDTRGLILMPWEHTVKYINRSERHFNHVCGN